MYNEKDEWIIAKTLEVLPKTHMDLILRTYPNTQLIMVSCVTSIGLCLV